MFHENAVSNHTFVRKILTQQVSRFQNCPHKQFLSSMEYIEFMSDNTVNAYFLNFGYWLEYFVVSTIYNLDGLHYSLNEKQILCTRIVFYVVRYLGFIVLLPPLLYVISQCLWGFYTCQFDPRLYWRVIFLENILI